MRYPPKPKPGDRVAIVSPSAALPEIFPQVYELGLARLREVFELEPVEYPTTRKLGSAPADRARDLHAAFSDPSITAVLATVGGDDQITVLRHLDADLLRANPKPYFGYSDNTNLLHYLYGLGIVSYHGGSILVHLGRSGHLHPAHEASLRAALFTSDWFELDPPDEWGDEPNDWNDPGLLALDPPMWPHEGWHWHNADQIVQGTVWGGNLEIVSWLLQAGLVSSNDAYEGVLILETSEEQPSATEVYRVLRNMGERGLLSRFDALVMGRAKAWSHELTRTPQGKREFVAAQRAAVLRAMSEYHPNAMIVFDVDLGHTDPQLIVPYGGTIRLDTAARRIFVHY